MSLTTLLSGAATRRPRRRSRRRLGVLAPMAAAGAIALAPGAAHAECSVRYQNQGSGWFGAYMCYGIAALGDGNCMYIDGSYYVVTVWCGELAVVEVTA